MKVTGTLYQEGRCDKAIQIDDPNELFDIGMGQYAMEAVAGETYYMPGGCGDTCKDEDSGRTWENCVGWKTTGTKNKQPLKVLIVAFIVIAALVALFIYLNNKK